MVSFTISCIVVGIFSQYVIHIADYSRRKYNAGYKVFVQYQRPEPFWFEVITSTNQILVCGGLFVLFIIGVLKYICL